MQPEHNAAFSSQKSTWNELSGRDYWHSNRVLASTLRLNPFSITVISRDVLPSCPACLQVHCTSARSFCQASDHSGVTREPPTDSIQTAFPPWLKSIWPSPVKKPLRNRRAPRPLAWFLGLRSWLAPRRQSPVTHSCHISAVNAEIETEQIKEPCP